VGSVTETVTGSGTLGTAGKLLTIFNASEVPSKAAVIGLDAGCGERPFTYVPQNATLGIVCIHNTNTTGAVEAKLEIWVAPGETVMQSVVLSTNGQFWFATQVGLPPQFNSCWVRPAEMSYNTSVTAGTTGGVALVVAGGAFTLSSGTISIVSSTNVDLLPIAQPPAFNVSSVPYSSTRLTAVSLLATNVTKVLNKEGTVHAARLNPRTSNPFSFLTSAITALHPAEKYYAGLEKGFYTFLPPSTDLTEFSDFSYFVPTDVETIPVYRLDNTAFVNAISFDDPDGGTSLALNVDWHIEFRNNSVLWPIGVSTTTLETLHQAQIVLLASGFFFDNIDHRAILQHVIKAANFVAPSLGAVGFPIRAAAKLGNYMLGRKVTQPKPTSAVATGLVKVPKSKKPPQKKVKVSKKSKK
jgi:hypothetical protein